MYHGRTHSRRAFLSAALTVPLLGSFSRNALADFIGSVDSKALSDNVIVVSPNGSLRFHLLARGRDRMSYRITFKNRPVIETSALGIIIDGTDLAEGAAVGKVESYRLRETYATRGVHSLALNHCNGA